MTDVDSTVEEGLSGRIEEVDENGVPVLLTEKQQMRYARMWLDNGVVNRNSFKNPLQVLAGIQAVKALGLQPMTALRQTGFINGQFIVYGNIPDAIVKRSGAREWKKEFCYVVDEKTGKYIERSFENSNLHLPVRGAVCIMKRVGEEHPHIGCFSSEDASLAGLWKKSGPWTTYPQIMLMYRARSLCIQKGFSDVTHCVATESDVENVVEQSANQRLRERLEKLEAERLRLQERAKLVPALPSQLEKKEETLHESVQEVVKPPTHEEQLEYEQNLELGYDQAVANFNHTNTPKAVGDHDGGP